LVVGEITIGKTGRARCVRFDRDDNEAEGLCSGSSEKSGNLDVGNEVRSEKIIGQQDNANARAA
jgi:hypothetical protein